MTVNNPPNKKPTMSFGEAMRAAAAPAGSAGSPKPPAAGDGKPFRLVLSGQGWLGQDLLGYAIPVTDQEQALVLERCPMSGGDQFQIRIKGSGIYMYVSGATGTDMVGFSSSLPGWDYGWTVSGTELVSNYNNYPLSMCSSGWGLCVEGFLYAYSGEYYITQDVTFDPYLPPPVVNPPLTPLIEHIVVLMLENRSFDNMLGGLYPSKTQAEYRGVNGLSDAEKSNPLDPGDPGKGNVKAFQAPAKWPEDHWTWNMPYPDPGELFNDMNEQLFSVSSNLKQCDTVAPCKPGSLPTMQGFAWNYAKQKGAPDHGGDTKVLPLIMEPVPQNVMQYFTEDAVRMTSFLAKQFAVCDDWFAAGPVQTLANRIFTHCGTPGLVKGTNCARVDNPDFTENWHIYEGPPVDDKTVFQLLDETYWGERINWKVYYHDAPASALCSYVYDHWDRLSSDSGNVYHWWSPVAGMTNFEYDIKNNRLPKYSFIEPCYTDTLGGTVNSSHPGGAGIDIHDPNGSSLPPPISVLDSEIFLQQVYEILANNIDTFKKTLLIVIFDEHGGLWDHVPPPCAVSPFVPPPDNFSYDRYGVRIPALLINPNIPPGTIYRASDPGKHFDHTSLISTVCAQFGLNGTLTPRSAAASTLANLIPGNPKFYNPPAPPQLQTAEPKPAAAKPEGIINLEDAMRVIRAQKHPHSLAGALVPLLYLEQQRRANMGDSTG